MQANSEHPNLQLYKWISFGGILVMTAFFAALPVVWKRFRNSEATLGIANSFSGGLFLAAGVVHILPECAAPFSDGEFPWPFFAAIMTYSQVLFVDRVIFKHHGAEVVAEQYAAISNQQNEPIIKRKKSVCCDDVDKDITNETNNVDIAEKMYKVMTSNKEGQAMSWCNYSKEHRLDTNKTEGNSKDNICSRVHPHNMNLDNNVKEKLLPNENIQAQNVTDKGETELKTDLNDVISVESLEHVKEPQEKPKVVLAPYLLVVAMGIHATFAGLGLGVTTDLGGFIGMLMAIIAHKWAESMTVGISFAKHLKDIGVKQSLFILFLFSLFTPLGILQGIMLSSSNQKFNAVLMGLSAGTFVYIAASEIIVEEFNVGRHKCWKFISYLMGVAQMSSVFFIEKACK